MRAPRAQDRRCPPACRRSKRGQARSPHPPSKFLRNHPGRRSLRHRLRLRERLRPPRPPKLYPRRPKRHRPRSRCLRPSPARHLSSAQRHRCRELHRSGHHRPPKRLPLRLRRPPRHCRHRDSQRALHTPRRQEALPNSQGPRKHEAAASSLRLSTHPPPPEGTSLSLRSYRELARLELPLRWPQGRAGGSLRASPDHR